MARAPNTTVKSPFAVVAVVRESKVQDLDGAPGGVLLLSQTPKHQLEPLACAGSMF